MLIPQRRDGVAFESASERRMFEQYRARLEREERDRKDREFDIVRQSLYSLGRITHLC
jgi:hypothetical protein